MKYVGVISDNYKQTVMWLIRSVLYGSTNIKFIDSSKMVHDVDRQVAYIIIEDKILAKGYEFHHYIRDPLYQSLEDLVKTRVR